MTVYMIPESYQGYFMLELPAYNSCYKDVMPSASGFLYEEGRLICRSTLKGLHIYSPFGWR